MAAKRVGTAPVGVQELRDAGFTDVVPIADDSGRRGQWFTVVAPIMGAGVVLRQSSNCWHYFARDMRATASSSCAARCHLGGLGDAIDTDARMRTYEQLLRDPPGCLLDHYEGLYAASSQVFNS